MTREEIEAQLLANALDAVTAEMLLLMQDKAKEHPAAFYRHSFHDVESNIVWQRAWLVSWLRAVYEHTVDEYAHIHEFDHKVGILCVQNKPRNAKAKKQWLAGLNAQIAEQIGSDVELVFKKKEK